jgi:heavy metal translocating P-type ATPase
MSELTVAGAQDQDVLLREAGSAGAERLERKLLIALAGGVLLAVSWISQMLDQHEQVYKIPAALGAIILVIPLLRGAWNEFRAGRPSSDSLASLAVLAAMASQNYLAAGFLALFLWMANLILSRTAWGAQRAIRDLIDLTPDVARLIDQESGQERQVPLNQVKVGQRVRVRAGENLPVDGRVVNGLSDINQASLTGEAVPVEASPGTEVYAGTTNLTGQIDVEATAVASQTTIGKVESLIREAESTKTERQELIEQLSAYYFPVVLMVALLVWFFIAKNPDLKHEAATRAITVLVVTCPGALLISHPTAMVAAFAAAARLGIMVKQTRTLESAATVDTVVLDKTGTLTTGKFAVSRLSPSEGVEGAALLQAAADSEQQSNHPLAKSILVTAHDARITPQEMRAFEEVHGRGVIARSTQDESGDIYAGRADWLCELNPSIRAETEAVEKKIEGMSGVHVMRGNRYLGAVGLEDKLRASARDVIDRIRHLGARRICIFTGDRLSVAKRVGQAVGVDAIEAQCLPEEKHEELRYLIRKGHRTLVVGDGINDGPILASADVGVAMGLSGSDIATNSAGVALMNDDLRHIPFLMELARKARAIVAQNITASLILAVVGLALAATGHINIWLTPFYYALGYIFVIANSLRLIRFGEDFTEQEEARRRIEERRAVKPVRAAQKVPATT